MERVTREEVMNRDNYMNTEGFMTSFSEYDLLHHSNRVAKYIEYIELKLINLEAELKKAKDLRTHTVLISQEDVDYLIAENERYGEEFQELQAENEALKVNNKRLSESDSKRRKWGMSMRNHAHKFNHELQIAKAKLSEYEANQKES